MNRIRTFFVSVSIYKLIEFFLFSYSLLADILHLTNWKDDSRQGILVDLYYYTLQYPLLNLVKIFN